MRPLRRNDGHQLNKGHHRAMLVDPLAAASLVVLIIRSPSYSAAELGQATSMLVEVCYQRCVVKRVEPARHGISPVSSMFTKATTYVHAAGSLLALQSRNQAHQSQTAPEAASALVALHWSAQSSSDPTYSHHVTGRSVGRGDPVPSEATRHSRCINVRAYLGEAAGYFRKRSMQRTMLGPASKPCRHFEPSSQCPHLEEPPQDCHSQPAHYD